MLWKYRAQVGTLYFSEWELKKETTTVVDEVIQIPDATVCNVMSIIGNTILKQPNYKKRGMVVNFCGIQVIFKM
jgi:hypothetical protein